MRFSTTSANILLLGDTDKFPLLAQVGAAGARVIRGAGVSTIDPENANEAIGDYVATVVSAIELDRLLPGTSPQVGL